MAHSALDCCVIEAPECEAVSSDMFMRHQRLTDCDDLELIGLYLASAREVVEMFLGRPLINTKFRLSLDDFSYCIDLCKAPVREICEVWYYDACDERQTVPCDVYQLDAKRGEIFEACDKCWPCPRLCCKKDAKQKNVFIDFVAGYGAKTCDIPAPIVLAVMQLAGHWYENREQTTMLSLQELPDSAKSFLSLYRRNFKF